MRWTGLPTADLAQKQYQYPVYYVTIALLKQPSCAAFTVVECVHAKPIYFNRDWHSL